MTAVTHIAGIELTIGDTLLRQRCGWCGAVLLDYDLSRVAVPAGQDPRPGTWPVGELVRVDGPVSTVVPHTPGLDRLPEDACALLDPAVTR